jgi:hypothetical protein
MVVGHGVDNPTQPVPVAQGLGDGLGRLHVIQNAVPVVELHQRATEIETYIDALLHELCARGLICGDHLTELFGVETLRERRRAH